ncbi:hypothetical protein GCM10009665_01360 [Kitasatospora nipponensis]|uniref:Transposase IS701-like DDE domain-containing protein n=1 Tax=Kitasatospora nipponensis TaxID=258049 RepID=A0ABP4G7T8_9ACTN
MDGPAGRQAAGTRRGHRGRHRRPTARGPAWHLQRRARKLGDPPVLIVADASYDGPRLAYLLRDLPVQIVVRLRSDRVFFQPVPADYRVGPKGGQPPRHGARFALSDTATWHDPDTNAEHITRRYGTARIRTWHRLHPRIWRRSGRDDHCGQLPIVEGTLIRLDVDHLPSGGTPKPVWLRHSDPTPCVADTDTAWHAFLRRFELEHTFRFLKQTLGWTRPRLREPAAADRWTGLVLAAHTQRRLARTLAVDLRRSWGPSPPNASPQPESDAGSATSAQLCSAQQPLQDHPVPVPGVHPASPTGAEPPSTTSDSPWPATTNEQTGENPNAPEDDHWR